MPIDTIAEEPLDVIAPPEYDELAPPVEIAPLDVVPIDPVAEEPLDVIAPPEYDELAPPVEIAPLDVVPIDTVAEEPLDVIAPPEYEVAPLGVVTPSTDVLVAPLDTTTEEAGPSPVGDSYWQARGVPTQSEAAVEVQPRQVGRRAAIKVALIWVRNAGLIALLFVAWQLWGTSLIEHHDQAALATEFRQLTARSTPSRSASTIPQLLSSTPATTPPGSLLGRLQIPAIGLDQYVVEGTSSSQLSNGPGHYIGTALPGYTGNIAIAGHRTTFGAQFGRLGAVVPGDAMYLTTTGGERFIYRVVIQPTAVLPSERSILNGFGTTA